MLPDVRGCCVAASFSFQLSTPNQAPWNSAREILLKIDALYVHLRAYRRLPSCRPDSSNGVPSICSWAAAKACERRDALGNRRGSSPCSTTRVSPFRMVVDAPVLGPAEKRVVSYSTSSESSTAGSPTWSRRFPARTRGDQGAAREAGGTMIWLRRKRRTPPLARCARAEAHHPGESAFEP